jgi:hypothetical protein
MTELLIIKNRLVEMLAQTEQCTNSRMMTDQIKANKLNKQIKISCHVDVPEDATEQQKKEIACNNKGRQPVREKAQKELWKVNDGMEESQARQLMMGRTINAVQELVDELMTLDESEITAIAKTQRAELLPWPIHIPLTDLLPN